MMCLVLFFAAGFQAERHAEPLHGMSSVVFALASKASIRATTFAHCVLEGASSFAIRLREILPAYQPAFLLRVSAQIDLL
jgi:hypothetical protein